MRKLIPALIVAVALVGLASPALASKPAEPVVSCGGLSLPKVELPRLDLPSVCDLKAHVSELAVKIGLSLKATLAGSVDLAVKLGAGIDATIKLLLSLPPLLAKLLCL